MKALLTIAVLALSVAACSKNDTAEDADKAKKAAAEAAGAEAAAPRSATYDPNLKVDPKTIVWDSPDKKRQWEQRQAELATKQGVKDAAGSK